MSAKLPPLLIIDDERNMRLSLQAIMTGEGYTVMSADSAEQGLKLVEQQEFFMVITDARLGGMSGYEMLGRMKARKPDLPILMITAFATPKLAVEAIRSGAMDYLAKPFEPEELLHAVGRCAERHKLLAENANLRARTQSTYELAQIIGDSPSIIELRQLIETVAPTNATVLILGESGTGKELIAGALHSLSTRHSQNYVRINCAAIPEALLESELFGHERGAFTGAMKQKPGRVEEADGGAIFLDEIGDMSRPLQAKLLRFLEDGTFTRVGGNQELHVDVRLIAATNRDIIDAIRQNHFREDLYHRLNVVQFRPPPLRERGQDSLLLARHFLVQFTLAMNRAIHGISKPAQQAMLSHHWPGNVRELRNVIERAVILERTAEIQIGNLPDFRTETRLKKGLPIVADGPASGASLDDMLMAYERELILSSYEQCHRSLTRTAEHLKLTRHALRYRLQRLELSLDSSSEEDSALTREKDAV